MEKQYHKLLEDILEHGEKTDDRTGVGTLSVFGYQTRYNLQKGFPAVTTKKLAFRSCVGELIWFLEGSTDERRLAELTYGKSREELVGKRTIWTDNADVQGKSLGYISTDDRKDLGQIYGAQWRKFGELKEDGGYIKRRGNDQLSWIINEIRTNPKSRRLILSAWDPNTLDSQALPPCHLLCQFSVKHDTLSCQLYQRSGDSFLGIPFNIASYSLLTHIIARHCGLNVGYFIHTIGDAHIYLNHIDQVKEQLSRNPYPLPELKIDDNFSLEPLLDDSHYEYPLNTASMFQLNNYQCHPTIKAPMAV